MHHRGVMYSTLRHSAKHFGKAPSIGDNNPLLAARGSRSSFATQDACIAVAVRSCAQTMDAHCPSSVIGSRDELEALTHSCNTSGAESSSRLERNPFTRIFSRPRIPFLVLSSAESHSDASLHLLFPTVGSTFESSALSTSKVCPRRTIGRTYICSARLPRDWLLPFQSPSLSTAHHPYPFPASTIQQRWVSGQQSSPDLQAPYRKSTLVA